MNRKALIIEASEVPRQDVLRGAKIDADSWRVWLKSNAGGGWFDSEIKVFNTPTIKEIENYVRYLSLCDYGFVAFSGHGYQSRELNEVKLCLRDGNLPARGLEMNASKCTIVIDACREVLSDAIMESTQESEVRSLYAKAAQLRNYRKEFEVLVDAAPAGVVWLFACDVSEAAGESSKTGGYFTQSLISAGKRASSDNVNGMRPLMINSAFQSAKQRTMELNKRQTPQIEAGRRITHFPFAI